MSRSRPHGSVAEEEWKYAQSAGRRRRSTGGEDLAQRPTKRRQGHSPQQHENQARRRRGTPPEYESVAFGEDETPAVDAHAHAMVFMVRGQADVGVHRDGRSRHVMSPARRGRAVEGVAAGSAPEGARGADPTRVHTGSAMPSRRRAHQAAAARAVRVFVQQVAGARKLVERLGVEPDQLLRPALPEPGEMTGVAGATQPAADGGRRAAAAWRRSAGIRGLLSLAGQARRR